MDKLMRLQIITPDRIMCDEQVKMVEMTTTEGEIGVLPGHIPVTTMLSSGIAHIRTADDKVLHAAIHEGFVEIRPDKVTILVEIAEWPGDVNINRAKAALKRAEERLQHPNEHVDIPRARRAWIRAMTRIELVTRQW